MKFIFPQNYNFKNKLFGFIDYTTIFINIIWILIVGGLSFLIFNNWSYRIFILITFCFPLFLLSVSGFQGENIAVVLSYLFRFIFCQKIYFFKK